MIWGTPAAFWLLTLIAPLVGLFLYRRRATLTIVPSIAFWTPRAGAVSGSPFGRRLRRVATLLAQIVILALLVLALADPKPMPEMGKDTFIIIDCSATMQTIESDGTRLVGAIALAQEIIDALPNTSQLTLIRTGQFPEVVFRNEGGTVRVRTALETLAAADTDADLSEAISFVRSMKRTEHPQRVVLISDFCGTDIGHLDATSMDLVFRQVGTPQPNHGIIDVRCLPNRQELVVNVGHNGNANRQCTVSVKSGDREIARRTVEADQQITELRFPVALRPGEEFKVFLEPVDPLMLDNVAYGVYPAASTVSIRLVSQGNVFLEQAIRAYQEVQIERVSPEKWNHSAGPDVTILDGPVLEALPTLSGRFIVFSPVTGSVEPDHDVELSSWHPDHPILGNIDPTSWGYLRGARLSPLQQSRVIVDGHDSAILYEWPDPEMLRPQLNGEHILQSQAIVFNFNLIESELPNLPAFPVLLWDTIFYVTGKGGQNEEGAMPTGSTIITQRLPRLVPPTLTEPGGRSGSMLRAGERFIWNSTEKQGIYQYRSTEDENKVAMNWMSMRSTLTCNQIAAPSDSLHTHALTVDTLLASVSWRMLLMIVAALIVAEWLLFNRRILRMD